jgi:hypothetical protein
MAMAQMPMDPVAMPPVEMAVAPAVHPPLPPGAGAMAPVKMGDPADLAMAGGLAPAAMPGAGKMIDGKAEANKNADGKTANGKAADGKSADGKGAPDQAGEAEEEDDLKPHPNFWQQKWVQNVLPLCTSLALHLGILLIGFLTYQAAAKIVETVKEQVVIPDAVLATDGQVGGIPNPGLGGDPNRAAAQDQIQETPADSKGIAQSKNNLSAAMASGTSGDASADAVIGMGGSNSGSVGASHSLGNGGGGGGEMAPWGVPGGGGGIGPKCKFLGSGGNALSIAFVCDSSGSMLTKMDLLKLEMSKTVRVLQPIQCFNVFFFHGSRDDSTVTFDAFSPAMSMANPGTKQKFYSWLDGITPRGETYVIPALQNAFAMNPKR